MSQIKKKDIITKSTKKSVKKSKKTPVKNSKSSDRSKEDVLKEIAESNQQLSKLLRANNKRLAALEVASSNTISSESPTYSPGKDRVIEAQKQEIDLLKAELNKRNRDLDVREDNLSAHLKSEQNLMNKIEMARRIIEQKEKQLLKQRTFITQLEDTLKSLEVETDKATANKNSAQALLERVDNENELLKQELAKQQRNVKVLKQDLQMSSDIRHERENQRVQTQKKISELVKDLRMMQEQLKIVDSANSEVLKKLKLEEQSKTKLTDELLRQRALVNETENKYKELLKEIEAKYDAKIRVLIAQNTDEELRMKAGVEALKERLAVELKREASMPKLKSKSEKKYIVAHYEELMPLVKLALTHGDNYEQIAKSLLDSGYHPDVVEEAVRRVKVTSNQTKKK